MIESAHDNPEANTLSELRDQLEKERDRLIRRDELLLFTHRRGDGPVGGVEIIVEVGIVEGLPRADAFRLVLLIVLLVALAVRQFRLEARPQCLRCFRRQLLLDDLLAPATMPHVVSALRKAVMSSISAGVIWIPPTKWPAGELWNAGLS